MRGAAITGAINRKIGQAMHDWNMLEHGDSVLVAVSGGIDSLVAAWVLQTWRAKAPIEYSIEAVYVDNGFWTAASGVESPSESIGRQLGEHGIRFSVVEGWALAEGEQRSCFTCARNRRSQLFELARSRGCNKLAFGHHKDDLIETFFINSLYSGNISTMLPRQDLFSGNLGLIRVLAYLEKTEVIELAGVAGLTATKNLCPLAGDTRRETVRELLEEVYRLIPGAKNSVFSALGNVRSGYLLSEKSCRST